MPWATSLTWSVRIPGVSITQPPPAMAWSERDVVVWRPLASDSRTPPVCCGSSCADPASVLTSVDLPTPDEPTTATVWPTPHHSASAAAASGCLGLSDDHAQIGLERRGLPLVVGGIVGRVGLGEEDHRRDPGVVGQRQVALEARRAEIGIARGDDEQRVDVGAGKLRRMTTGGAALEQRLAIQPAMQGVAVRIGKHPVADGELTGVGARRQNQREPARSPRSP